MSLTAYQIQHFKNTLTILAGALAQVEPASIPGIACLPSEPTITSLPDKNTPIPQAPLSNPEVQRTETPASSAVIASAANTISVRNYFAGLPWQKPVTQPSNQITPAATNVIPITTAATFFNTLPWQCGKPSEQAVQTTEDNLHIHIEPLPRTDAAETKTDGASFIAAATQSALKVAERIAAKASPLDAKAGSFFSKLPWSRTH